MTLKFNYGSSLLVMAFFIGLTFSGCDKSEGYGGTSRISGAIETRYYNDDYSKLIRQVPAVDEEVFLLFGNNENVGDRVETSATGSFEFNYLRAGKYMVYYSSIDSTVSGEQDKVVAVEIDLKEGEDKDLGTLARLQILDFDDGSAKIHGVIRLINYKNSSVYPFLEVKDTSYAQEHEVYLTYGAHEFYDERIRTSYNGYFEFNDLIPGDYEIFTYSEDKTGATERIPVIRNVTITEPKQEIDLGVLFVEQL